MASMFRAKLSRCGFRRAAAQYMQESSWELQWLHTAAAASLKKNRAMDEVKSLVIVPEQCMVLPARSRVLGIPTPPEASSWHIFNIVLISCRGVLAPFGRLT